MGQIGAHFPSIQRYVHRLVSKIKPKNQKNGHPAYTSSEVAVLLYMHKHKNTNLQQKHIDELKELARMIEQRRKKENAT